jgi:hypothetical protein
MVNATPWPLYPLEEHLLPTVQDAGWAPGPFWTDAENLASTGIRSPDRPARSNSLYRLSYPGPLSCIIPLSKPFKAEIKYVIFYLTSLIFFLIRHIVFAAFEAAVA